MFKDLRQYLDYLEEVGKLKGVPKEVDPCYDIAAGVRKASDTDGPALLFESIRGHPGWRVVGGVYGTQELMALALDLPMEASEEQILQRYLDCYDRRVKPRRVATGPVKEIILKGDEVDLTKLPIPTYHSKDVGPYLTAGVEIAKHPETGIANVSIDRRRLLGKDRTALATFPSQHLGMCIAAAEAKGQGLEVATVIGPHPSLAIASQIKAPFGVDEIEIAGALRGEPFEVVKCETIDVEVPADAEIVIEGVTIPGEKATCGPFAEYPGNYMTLGGLTQQFPVVKVTAITMRKDAIFQAMLCGMPMTENHWLKKWSLAAQAYREASKIADVKAVNMTVGGTAGLHTVIAINKRTEMEPRNVIQTLLGGARLGTKLVIVVDADIDVYNPVEVEWAICTRCVPPGDIYILPPTHRGVVGPSLAELPYRWGQWGIDATMPLMEREWYQRATVPGVDKVDYI